MARRIALALGCLGYAALALGSGLDRISAQQPALASRVPALFASEALRVRGGQALTAGDAKAALALGKAAIADSPTDPQSAAMLGAGRLASGERGGADLAFRVAGKLGWRVPITQSYWMARALEANDYRIAAMRLDALLRQQPDLHRQRSLLDPMERNPAGRTALVERMAAAPVWLDAYAGDVASLPVDAMLQRVPVLIEAADRRLVLGCSAIAPGANRLAVLGQFSEGAALWRAHCPVAGQGLVGDGQFMLATLGERPSAFAWELQGNNELALGFEVSPSGPGKRLTVHGTPARTRLVATQLLTLAPGRYLLSWRSGNSQDLPSDAVVASLTCRGIEPVWLTPTLDRGTGLWQAEANVAAGCGAQILGFGVTPAAGEVWLEGVELKLQR
ncbi:hypothetical protein [Novosphingobium sp.]|uniref:hypothetical protein n=1 Tax=Novosphingobium sp. TaxID=1874826 RepID=UPI0025E2FBF6|nr:hypothetical protein [Novosphingobium sp.]MCC6926669.1 hypothetical protein [Novosphingobium sp.]